MNTFLTNLWVQVLSLVASRRSEERGAVSSEYAILLFLIAVALITAITTLRNNIIDAFNAAAAVLP